MKKPKKTKSAKEKGYDAFLTGKDESSNPYSVTTDEHLSWNDGYHEAEDEDALESMS